MQRSIIKSQAMRGILGQQSSLKPKGGKEKKALYFVLSLTSLIDAFSILVIYLLISYSNQQSVELSGKVKLPVATHSEGISDGVIVSVNQGHYYLDQKEVTLSQLTSELLKRRSNKPEVVEGGLVIEADKASDYQKLSPIILAGAQAGYSKFKFAVIPDGEKN